MIEAQVFAVAEVLGKINDNGREPASLNGGVGGKPDGCKESFSVVALPPAAKLGSKLLRLLGLHGGEQSGKKFAYGLSGKRSAAGRQEVLARVVGEQDGATGVNGDDRDRTALDQRPQLFFDFLPERDLRFHFNEMHHGHLAAANDFGNKEAGADKSRRSHQQAGDGFIGGKLTEEFLEDRADQSHQGDLPARKKAGDKENREQIEKADGNEGLCRPIDDGDDNDENRRGGEKPRAIVL